MRKHSICLYTFVFLLTPHLLETSPQFGLARGSIFSKRHNLDRAGGFICPEPGVFPVKGGDCHTYNRCLFGGMYAFGYARCPIGFLFHPVRRRCDLKQLVDCAICAVDGEKVDPRSEGNYIRCVDGIGYSLECPSSQIYDEEKKYCIEGSTPFVRKTLSESPNSEMDSQFALPNVVKGRGSQAMASAVKGGGTQAMAGADTGDGAKSMALSEGVEESQAVVKLTNDSVRASASSEGASANSEADSTGAFVQSSADGRQNSKAMSYSQSGKEVAVSASDQDGSQAKVNSGAKNSSETPLGQSQAIASVTKDGLSYSGAEVANKKGMNASAAAEGNGTAQSIAQFNETYAQAMSAAEGVSAMSGADQGGSQSMSKSEGTINTNATALSSNNETESIAASNRNGSQAKSSLKFPGSNLPSEEPILNSAKPAGRSQNGTSFGGPTPITDANTTSQEPDNNTTELTTENNKFKSNTKTGKDMVNVKKDKANQIESQGKDSLKSPVSQSTPSSSEEPIPISIKPGGRTLANTSFIGSTPVSDTDVTTDQAEQDSAFGSQSKQTISEESIPNSYKPAGRYMADTSFVGSTPATETDVTTDRAKQGTASGSQSTQTPSEESIPSSNKPADISPNGTNFIGSTPPTETDVLTDRAVQGTGSGSQSTETTSVESIPNSNKPADGSLPGTSFIGLTSATETNATTDRAVQDTASGSQSTQTPSVEPIPNSNKPVGGYFAGTSFISSTPTTETYITTDRAIQGTASGSQSTQIPSEESIPKSNEPAGRSLDGNSFIGSTPASETDATTDTAVQGTASGSQSTQTPSVESIPNSNKPDGGPLTGTSFISSTPATETDTTTDRAVRGTAFALQSTPASFEEPNSNKPVGRSVAGNSFIGPTPATETDATTDRAVQGTASGSPSTQTPSVESIPNSNKPAGGPLTGTSFISSTPAAETDATTDRAVRGTAFALQSSPAPFEEPNSNKPVGRSLDGNSFIGPTPATETDATTDRAVQGTASGSQSTQTPSVESIPNSNKPAGGPLTGTSFISSTPAGETYATTDRAVRGTAFALQSTPAPFEEPKSNKPVGRSMDGNSFIGPTPATETDATTDRAVQGTASESQSTQTPSVESIPNSNKPAGGPLNGTSFISSTPATETDATTDQAVRGTAFALQSTPAPFEEPNSNKPAGRSLDGNSFIGPTPATETDTTTDRAVQGTASGSQSTQTPSVQPIPNSNKPAGVTQAGTSFNGSTPATEIDITTDRAIQGTAFGSQSTQIPSEESIPKSNEPAGRSLDGNSFIGSTPATETDATTDRAVQGTASGSQSTQTPSVESIPNSNKPAGGPLTGTSFISSTPATETDATTDRAVRGTAFALKSTPAPSEEPNSNKPAGRSLAGNSFIGPTPATETDATTDRAVQGTAFALQSTQTPSEEPIPNSNKPAGVTPAGTSFNGSTPATDTNTATEEGKIGETSMKDPDKATTEKDKTGPTTEKEPYIVAA